MKMIDLWATGVCGPVRQCKGMRPMYRDIYVLPCLAGERNREKY